MTTFARFFQETKKHNLIMNKELTTAATLSLGVRSYESPAVNVVEVLSEGVLCSSLTDGREGNFFDFEDGGDLF